MEAGQLEALREPEAVDALLRAQRRVFDLPHDAKPREVQSALLLLGTNAEMAQNERTSVTKLNGLRRRLEQEAASSSTPSRSPSSSSSAAGRPKFASTHAAESHMGLASWSAPSWAMTSTFAGTRIASYASL